MVIRGLIGSGKDWLYFSLSLTLSISFCFPSPPPSINIQHTGAAVHTVICTVNGAWQKGRSETEGCLVCVFRGRSWSDGSCRSPWAKSRWGWGQKSLLLTPGSKAQPKGFHIPRPGVILGSDLQGGSAPSKNVTWKWCLVKVFILLNQAFH